MGSGSSMVAICSVALITIATILSYFITSMQIGSIPGLSMGTDMNPLFLAGSMLGNIATLIVWNVPEQYLPWVLNIIFVKSWAVGIVVGVIGMLLP